jgi:diguanylate cyclase
VVLVERDATATVMSSELMSRQLLIDPLTEVWRRSALITDMERRSARPDRQTFSVLFIDLDGFKAINDRFGHEAGDTVLRAVGAIMKSQVREHDVAARYGGDEFVVVVDDDAKESNARRVAQRIVAAIPTVTGLRYPDIRFGASIGIACFPRDADTPADVIRCADHAMYAAKRAGGGRVVSWVDVKVKPSWNSAPPSAEVLTLRRRG